MDVNAARQRLTEARDSLSQLASMPEASKLQGDARAKVSELISNFNALISSQSDWRAAYAKVNDSLTGLIGPDTEPNANQGAAASAATGTAATGTAGTAGTAGTGTAGTAGTAGAAETAGTAGGGIPQLDPAIRGKLVEFRTHLKEFQKAAGGPAEAPAAPAASEASAGSANASAAMPPANLTGSMSSTSNPANPATAVQGTAGRGTAGTADTGTAATAATGTTGTSATETAGTSGAVGTSGSATDAVPSAQQELAAIDAILAKSKTGALTKAQTLELRRHVDALHALLNQK
jgi:hypothetical protein